MQSSTVRDNQNFGQDGLRKPCPVWRNAPFRLPAVGKTRKIGKAYAIPEQDAPEQFGPTVKALSILRRRRDVPGVRYWNSPASLGRRESTTTLRPRR